MNREILTGMQTGAAALGQIHQNMYVPAARAVIGGEGLTGDADVAPNARRDVDAVDDIRDRMEEQVRWHVECLLLMHQPVHDVACVACADGRCQ